MPPPLTSSPSRLHRPRPRPAAASTRVWRTRTRTRGARLRFRSGRASSRRSSTAGRRAERSFNLLQSLVSFSRCRFPCAAGAFDPLCLLLSDPPVLLLRTFVPTQTASRPLSSLINFPLKEDQFVADVVSAPRILEPQATVPTAAEARTPSLYNRRSFKVESRPAGGYDSMVRASTRWCQNVSPPCLCVRRAASHSAGKAPLPSSHSCVESVHRQPGARRTAPRGPSGRRSRRPPTADARASRQPRAPGPPPRCSRDAWTPSAARRRTTRRWRT